MFNLKNKLKGFQLFSKQEKDALKSLLQVDEFKLLLKVERARADRNNSVFSLVLFEVDTMQNEATSGKFVQVLQKRIRAVDIVGWFDGNTIGVILHGTNTEGAWKFAIDVGVKLFKKQTPPPFVVFSYPDHWYDDKDIEFKNFNTLEETEEKTGNNVSARILDLNSAKTAISCPVSYSRDTIKTVFVKPMPVWKRAIDIMGSLFGLILLSPIFLLTAAYIKLVSPGPIFFKQGRVGYKGKMFTLLKFRTMKPNNESLHASHFKNFFYGDKPMAKLDGKKDPRIIPGGSLLRKACIDELPQLINVLIGEMSLIGPRPCIPYEAAEYLRWHHRRFDMVPGMSGLWQVSGKNDLSFKQMVRLDIQYGEKMSFLFDLKILFLTVPTVFGMIFEKLRRKLAKKAVEKKMAKIKKQEDALYYQMVKAYADKQG